MKDSLGAIKVSLPGGIENTVAAHHEFKCKLLGADRLSYPSVVGGGPGALVVHYAENNRVLRAGELLLMDAGCERRGYVSDITRTWPIGPGGFSDAQADVYDAVLEARDSCLRATKIGASLSDLHSLSVSVLSECLVRSWSWSRARKVQFDSQWRLYEVLPSLGGALAGNGHSRYTDSGDE